MIKDKINKILSDLDATRFDKIYKSKFFTLGDDKTFFNISVQYSKNNHQIFFYYSYYKEGKEIECFSKHFALVEYTQTIILFNKIKKLIKDNYDI